MAIHIRRREFIFTLGGTADAWPLAARAQQPTMPVIGFLSSGTQESDTFRLIAFRQGLIASATQSRGTRSMARTEGLLGERQRITHTRSFKRAKHSLHINRFGLALGLAAASPCLPPVAER